MIVEGLHRTPVPRCLVMAFMAGLALASGYSSQCYVEELLKFANTMPWENN